ncbi:hypothetical protein C8R45DRAFT_966958, partial [Mycena sanguinolenta]
MSRPFAGQPSPKKYFECASKPQFPLFIWLRCLVQGPTDAVARFFKTSGSPCGRGFLYSPDLDWFSSCSIKSAVAQRIFRSPLPAYNSPTRFNPQHALLHLRSICFDLRLLPRRSRRPKRLFCRPARLLRFGRRRAPRQPNFRRRPNRSQLFFHHA